VIHNITKLDFRSQFRYVSQIERIGRSSLRCKTMKLSGMKYATNGSPVFPAVARALAKLGKDISFARRSRHIAAADFAHQMGVSRATLHRLEAGDAGVSLNTLAMAMNALGRLDLLGDLVEQTNDQVGLLTARLRVPRRIVRVKARNGANRGENAAGGPLVTESGVEGW